MLTTAMARPFDVGRTPHITCRGAWAGHNSVVSESPGGAHSWCSRPFGTGSRIRTMPHDPTRWEWSVSARCQAVVPKDVPPAGASLPDPRGGPTQPRPG